MQRSVALGRTFVFRPGLTGSVVLLGLLGVAFPACAPVAKHSEPKEAASQTAPSGPVQAWVVEVGTSPSLGPTDAWVTLVEFSDFECPFCAEVHPTVRELMQRYPGKIRWVMKHNPLGFHKLAQPLALFALAVREQHGEAAYWEALDAIFETPEPTPQRLLELATRFKLDPERYSRTIALGADHPQLAADREQAVDLVAEGTPYFFVNGQRLPGAQPPEAFEAVMEQELARVGALLRATPSRDPYALMQASAAPPPGLTRVAVAPPDMDTPSWGPENAPVVVQMFSDFECGFCQRVMFTLRELSARHPGQVRIVWRNLPLPFHRHARWAARVAMEVREQRGDAAFWQLADRLFGMNESDPEPLTPQLIARYAAEVGLAAESVAALEKNDEHDASIKRDVRLAESVGATGTPTFIINGYRLVGAQPLDRFERLVKLALKDAPANTNSTGAQPTASNP